MMQYNAISAAPSNQVDSPSKAMIAASTTATSSATISIGPNTRVSEASPKIWLTNTSTGANTRAI